MITSLRGILIEIGPDHLVVETGGIGYLIYAPRPVLSSLGEIGGTVFMQTLLVVREDALTLYGFTTTEQRSIFATLLGVTGIGPKGALNLLSFIAPAELRLAVAHDDLNRLARIPGIGKKTAARLALELKNKLDLKGLPSTATSSPAALTVNQELFDLLVNLGYSANEANEAVAALPLDAPPDLEERLRLTLRFFGGA